MTQQPKTIAFIGLYNDTNLGDNIIQNCTEWLFKKGNLNFEIKRLSLMLDIKASKPSIFIRAFRKLLRNTIGRFHPMISTYSLYTIKDLKSYYRKELKSIDAIVFVGGGLIKYQHQVCCWGGVSTVINIAYKYKIPVYFNATGVEGYDDNDANCLLLKKSLQLPNVKLITTRDDIETLEQKYLDNQHTIPCTKVADSAVWASEVFGITKKENSEIIGIGIGRDDLFRNHGYNCSPIQYKTFIIELIMLLLQRGYRVELFTNGDYADNHTAKIIKNSLSTPPLLTIPNNSQELIECISHYKAIIAPRLHSSIIAYSLNVPSIGMIWNEKVTMFFETIKRKEWILRDNEFTPNIAYQKIEKSIKEGYDIKHKELYRNSVVESVQGMLISLSG